MMKRISSSSKRRLANATLLILFVHVFLAVAASGAEKLIFAIDLIRHGARTAVSDVPAAPHRWAEGLGELTPTGIQQEYELGARLRTFYVDQHHLLPANYSSETVYARSTDVDRTLMSAQAFLMGLYPPGTGPTIPATGQSAAPFGYQPVPIHTIPKDTDALLIPNYDTNKYFKLLRRYVFSAPAWKAKSEELKPKFQSWSEAAGTPITSLYQLVYLGDSLNVYRLHQVPLPPAIENDAQTIIDAGRWAFVEGYRPSEISRRTSHALLAEIAHRFQEAAKGKSPLKYVLYSAHDSTQLSALSALGAPLSNVPPYASDLRFLLFETDRGIFRIDVSFNDQPVILPFAGGSSCSLAQFEALAKMRKP